LSFDDWGFFVGMGSFLCYTALPESTARGNALSDSQRHILRMLEDGRLTSDQALKLLQAVDRSEGIADSAEVSEGVPPAESPEASVLPDMDRFRRLWQYPFFVCLSALLLTVAVLRSLYNLPAGANSFGLVCVWSLFGLMLVLTALSFISRQGTWVHVRAKRRRGKTIAISLPLPLGFARWMLGLVSQFVGDSDRDRLTVVATFIDTAKENLRSVDADPLVIDVDDQDGDRIQVFIGR
jgi:hypothetical protein